MNRIFEKELNYFPGCSLATTAKENNASLLSFLAHFDIRLTEVEDWSCCGSSSTHSVNSKLALSLAARNLFQAAHDKPVLIACPSCFLRLEHARLELNHSKAQQAEYEEQFGRSYDENIKLVHFFELLADMNSAGLFENLTGRLNGLKIAPYYGCMLAKPPIMKKMKDHSGLIEKTMGTLGAESIRWGYQNRCCGTFLSATRPEVSGRLVNKIMADANGSGAECVVTACAMCHLNLEMRCDPAHRLPVFHFSELLSMALTGTMSKDWMNRHLIDPEPLLNQRFLTS